MMPGDNVKCAVCGSNVPEGGVFCPTCGMIATEGIRLDDPRLSASKENLRKAVAGRQRTDRIVKTSWIVLPIALLVISYIVTPIAIFLAVERIGPVDPTLETDQFWNDLSRDTLAILAIIFSFSITAQLFYAWMAFRLVDRQNGHFEREKALRESVLRLLRSAAWSPERMQMAGPEIMTLEQGEARASHRHHDSLTWAFIVALPAVGITLMVLGFAFFSPSLGSLAAVVGLIGVGGLIGLVGSVMTFYMFYFLGKEMYEHDARWASFIFLARRAMSKLGFPQGRTYCSIRLPERSFALYLILAIFFFPFMYYWWYALMKDPNEHFQRQWEFEDHLLVATGQGLLK